MTHKPGVSSTLKLPLCSNSSPPVVKDELAALSKHALISWSCNSDLISGSAKRKSCVGDEGSEFWSGCASLPRKSMLTRRGDSVDGEEGALPVYLGVLLDEEEDGDVEERWRKKRAFQEEAPDVRTKNSWPDRRGWVVNDGSDVEAVGVSIAVIGICVSEGGVSPAIKER